MRNWNAPVIEELNISETAKDMFGQSKDGGYIGDGELTLGHLKAISGTWQDKANEKIESALGL